MSVDENVVKLKELANKLGPLYVYELVELLNVLRMSYQYRLDFRERCEKINND